MNSDTLVTILLSVLAIAFGIFNARSKKKQAAARLPRRTVVLPEAEYKRPAYEYARASVQDTELPEEAPAATDHYADQQDVQMEQQTPSEHRKYGFNPRQAVLFSEILRPKFDEFG
ncbi:MAG: hypothetical protein WCY73_02980 [Bacteroidales bacterium]|jgi:hypothetical protein